MRGVPGGLGALQANMEYTGTSAPVPAPYGAGRRYIPEDDHQVTCGFDLDPGPPPRPTGRRAIFPADHVKAEVMTQLEGPPPSAPTPDAKKAEIQELASQFGVQVYDERRWQQATVRQHGGRWVVEALTEQRAVVAREGLSARIIAEKLSMMPMAELRYFGLRLAGPGDARAAAQPAAAARPGALGSANLTLASPGVHAVLGNGPPGASCARRDPELLGRRYIASGQHHFETLETAQSDAPGAHGHAKDVGVVDGLERGIGHGRRFIGVKSNLFGGTLAP